MNRNHLPVWTPLILIMLLSMVTYSQVGQLRGKLVLKSPDGAEVPAGHAMIDVFRVDLRADYHTRTDEKGEFVFAGLPYVGTYLIAASAEGARPAVATNVKVGREVDYKLVLEPGDGKRFTREEATESAAVLNKPPTFETPDQIKARTFREGNAALVLRRYDEAIRIFEEGAAVIPPEPALFTNLAVALTQRAVERHNTAVCCTRDPGSRQALLRSLQDDVRKAVEVSTHAVELLSPKPMKDDEIVAWEHINYFALKAKAEAMRLLVSLVDPAQATSAIAALQDYLNVEVDVLKKNRAELDAARMLIESKNANLATERYRDLLIRDPDNLEALAGLGFALLESSGDKTKEAREVLQRFMDLAPEAHVMRSTVNAALKKIDSHP